MRRREFLARALRAAGTAAWATSAHGCIPGPENRPLAGRGSTPGRKAASTAARSNVLFIVVDDLNDWIEPLGGHPGVRTPNINRLARMGLTFTRAYCAVPSCGASRASTLSGVSPLLSNLYDFSDFRTNSRLAGITTLPAAFRRHGYDTRGGGKIFHGHYEYDYGTSPGASRWNPVNQDADAWVEFADLAPEPRPAERANGLQYSVGNAMDWMPLPLSDEDMPDAKIARWAADRLRRPPPAPWFLGVGLYRPHLPWYVPQAYFDLYPPGSLALPAHRPDDLEGVPLAGREMVRWGDDHHKIADGGKWEEAVRAYCASISFADACLGHMLDAVEETNRSTDTTIVLWSDNGFHLGEKSAWRKFTMWERANRVPLIIAPPRYAHAGQRCHRTVGLLDLYPTLTDLCLGDTPAHANGKSLRPLLEDPQGQWDRPAISSWRQGPDAIHHSVRTERHRYIRYADGSEELYDHVHDPNEWDNLLGRAPGSLAGSTDAATRHARELLAHLLTTIRPV